MPARRIPLVKVRRLATLLATEHSLSSVSRDLGVSRSTVADYRKHIQASGYSFTDFGGLDVRKNWGGLEPATHREAARSALHRSLIHSF